LTQNDSVTHNECEKAAARLANQIALERAKNERIERNMNASLAEILA